MERRGAHDRVAAHWLSVRSTSSRRSERGGEEIGRVTIKLKFGNNRVLINCLEI